MKKTKSREFAHTPKSPQGVGDFYGTGIKQPLGKIRGNSLGMIVPSSKKLKTTPPRSLA